jgi:hypothetical protein
MQSRLFDAVSECVVRCMLHPHGITPRSRYCISEVSSLTLSEDCANKRHVVPCSMMQYTAAQNRTAAELCLPEAQPRTHRASSGAPPANRSITTLWGRRPAPSPQELAGPPSHSPSSPPTLLATLNQLHRRHQARWLSIGAESIELPRAPRAGYTRPGAEHQTSTAYTTRRGMYQASAPDVRTNTRPAPPTQGGL